MNVIGTFLHPRNVLVRRRIRYFNICEWTPCDILRFVTWWTKRSHLWKFEYSIGASSWFLSPLISFTAGILINIPSTLTWMKAEYNNSIRSLLPLQFTPVLNLILCVGNLTINIKSSWFRIISRCCFLLSVCPSALSVRVLSVQWVGGWQQQQLMAEESPSQPHHWTPQWAEQRQTRSDWMTSQDGMLYYRNDGK